MFIFNLVGVIAPDAGRAQGECQDDGRKSDASGLEFSVIVRGNKTFLCHWNYLKI